VYGLLRHAINLPECGPSQSESVEQRYSAENSSYHDGGRPRAELPLDLFHTSGRFWMRGRVFCLKSPSSERRAVGQLRSILGEKSVCQGGLRVSWFSRLAAAWTACISKPAADRSVEIAIKRHRPRRILEIGLGDGQRARRAITLAQRYQGRQEVHFTGIDLFEDRHGELAPYPLKDAYRQLRSTAARVRLIPGDAYGALVRAANSLSQIELVLISSDVNKTSLAAAWFYLPRTLAPGAVVLWADGSLPDGVYREVPRAEILASARPVRAVRRRAA
jgi:hypothetical protein